MAMIEIKNISKWYGNFQVLKDCSVDVEKGEVVVIHLAQKCLAFLQTS